MDLVQAALAGERLALTRLLTQVENDTAQGRSMLDQLFAHTGRAYLIGITGSPGAGKSSLVNQIARALRNPRDGSVPVRVAVVAIDPTSPFTGGALLGDRVRMRDLAGDPGVFIRSMASRGALGGLARSTAAVVQALDAAGFEYILIETVGAGQSEVDIASLAHTTIVVEAPGMGDDIQAIKAGILEIADILVINKADHPGLENTERALHAMLEMAHPTRQLRGKHALLSAQPPETEIDPPPLWVPPILATIAPQAQGVDEVVAAIRQHRTYLESSGERSARDQARLSAELDQIVQAELVRRWQEALPPDRYPNIFNNLANRQISPYQAVAELLK